MQVNDYYKNLSKTWSGNYLAMLGLIILIIPTLSAILTITDIVINNNSIYTNNIFQEYLKIICCFLPFTCLYAIFPIFLLFIFLFMQKAKVGLPIIILSIVIGFIAATQSGTFDFNLQNTEMYLFVPLILFPIPLIFSIVFFILLLIDLTKTSNIKNLELVNNRYYKSFVNIFFLIGLIIFIFAPILYLTIVIPN